MVPDITLIQPFMDSGLVVKFLAKILRISGETVGWIVVPVLVLFPIPH